MPTTDRRQHLIKRVARSLAWAERSRDMRDAYLYRAQIVVDDLLSASGEGKAVERALKVIEKDEQIA